MSSSDPDSVLDFVLLGGTIAAVIPFLVANGVVFRHRKRKYFEASGWELILGSSVAGLIWIGASFIVNQHFKRDKFKFLSYCALWTFWLQLTLGICLWMSFMALRLYHLVVYCSTGKSPSYLRVWGLYLPAMLAPAIIFGIIATIMRVCRHPCGVVGWCIMYHTSWKLCTFLVLPSLYFSVIVLLLLRFRKQKDYLLRTQFQHTTDYAMMSFVLYLLTGTTYWSEGQNNVEGRCFLTFCVCSIVFIHFWVHTGWPVYLCLFKPAAAMDKYEENLRRNGAYCLRRYPYVPSVDANGNVILETFSLEGEEAIFQAIAAEQSKKEELKMKRDQLQRRLTEVRSKIEEMENRTVAAVLSLSLPPVIISENCCCSSSSLA